MFKRSLSTFVVYTGVILVISTAAVFYILPKYKLSQLNNPVLKYRGYDCDWKSRLRLKPFKKCGLEVLLKT